MDTQEELRKLIGSRIALVRKASNLNQEQLGEIIGANKQTVSRWERGVRSPDAEALRMIAEACNCSADFLVGLTDVLEIRR